MAAFLYFLPDCGSGPIAKVADLGEPFGPLLDPVIGTAGVECRRGIGPQKLQGLILAVLPVKGGEQAECSYDAKRQTWHKICRPDLPDVWVGYETANPPTPPDLIRERTVEGSQTVLGDGNEWLIPIVGPRYSNLPKEFRRAADGNFAATVKARYLWLFEASEKYFDLMFEGGTLTMTEFFEFAAGVLAVNYRLGPDEIGGDVLNLVEDFRAFVGAACGLAEVRKQAEQKKSTAAADGST